MLLVHFLQRFWAIRSQEKSLSSIVHFWVSHYRSSCAASSCISSLSFSFGTEDSEHFTFLLSLGGFCLLISFVVKKLRFPLRNSEISKEKPTFPQYPQKGNALSTHPLHTLVLRGQVSAGHFVFKFGYSFGTGTWDENKHQHQNSRFLLSQASTVHMWKTCS